MIEPGALEALLHKACRVRGCNGTKMRKYAREEMPEEGPPEGFMVPPA